VLACGDAGDHCRPPPARRRLALRCRLARPAACMARRNFSPDQTRALLELKGIPTDLLDHVMRLTREPRLSTGCWTARICGRRRARRRLPNC
jgi:hypothetical protein